MKKISLFLVSFIMLFLFNSDVFAQTATVNINDILNLRSNPTVNSAVITGLYNGTVMNVLSTNAGSGNGCNDNWYKVTYGSYTGYVCSTYVALNPETNTDNVVNQDNSYVKSNYDIKSNYDGSIMCYEDDKDLYLMSSAGGSFNGKRASCGDKVNINKVQESSGTCPYYYNITMSNGNTGWVCGYFVNTTKLSDTAKNYYNKNGGVDKYYTTLKGLGFPDSYLSYLAEIHARYPNWNFVAEKINLDFTNVVNNESVNGRSLLEGSAFGSGYKSMASHTYNILNDSFSYYPSEYNWYNASSEAVAYFMDPRNYLNTKYIFAFETLGYSANQNDAVVGKILSGQSFWSSVYNYYNKENAIKDSAGNVSKDIVKASSEVGISAVHVAARIKQEISGIATSDPRLGGTFTYNNTNYSGYYNFFNIGVYGNNKIVNGMKYAMDQGWNTPFRGLKGGASFMYNGYISVNQDTLYYEKFDVSTSDGNYAHQYMQNLAAPIQEGGSKYNGYVTTLADYLNNGVTFVIPVYNNMPNYAVTAPRIGNPNNYLKDLKVNDSTVSGFNYATYNYNVHLNSNVKSVVIAATKINNNASVIGTGTINITSNDQTNVITVTSQNGKVRKYTIKFTRDVASTPVTVTEIMNNSGFKYNDKYVFGIDVGTNVNVIIGNISSYNSGASVSVTDSSGKVKNNASFVTGDKIKVVGKDGTKEYTAIIYGDISGDGLIDKNDLLYVQSAAFGYVTLDSIKAYAADINKDGKVDKNDLLYVQSHVFGYSTISQK